jgi:hypothetical protein
MWPIKAASRALPPRAGWDGDTDSSRAGAVLTAVALLCPWPTRPGLAALGWAAGVLGGGPFAAYVASRTVGVPGDRADIGNWGYWLSTVSLLAKPAMVLLTVRMLPALRERSSSAASAA